MYLGRIVELGPTRAIFGEPLHPYTTALLSATLVPDSDSTARRARIILSGDPPSPIAPPSACRFRTRCPIGPLVRPERTICAESDPPLVEHKPGHVVACHFPGELQWSTPDPRPPADV
jgi:peptide/nickel transport system ATP-binding protein